ncbi:MAG: ribosome maturation factor RimP [Firmicutes bacterium]|nr:ribosome maturation factor RimP [Bacillota bacterium]
MSRDRLKQKLHGLIEPVIEEHGLELARLDFSTGRKAHLGIFIDKPGGVTIKDCEMVSRAVSDLLDAYDPIPQSYILEVSSPGVERQLSGAGDFKRFQGEMVKIYTAEKVAGRQSFQGKLTGFAGDLVKLTPEGGEEISIPLELINKAQLWFRP